jgi:hypothetical protein
MACPVLSDYVMYPKGGFAILRHAEMPAILSEGSFHSNPEEEQRLRDPDYNRQEARALFIGLARYAYGGVPRAKVVDPADGAVSPRGSRKVVIELDDGISPRGNWGTERRLILKDSIVIRVGGKKLPFKLDEKSNRVTVQLPADTKAGTVNLEVQFENLFKHSNTRPRVRLRMKPWNN